MISTHIPCFPWPEISPGGLPGGQRGADSPPPAPLQAATPEAPR